MAASSSIDEKQCIRLAKTGDDDAFAQLVGAYQTPVYNLCYRMLGDHAQAEDAAQETFLRAFRNLRRYDPNRRLITWLLSIASNYCIDQLRKRRMRVVPIDNLLPQQQHAADGLGPEESLARREQQQAVQILLRGLGPLDRAAVILRYWYDCSYEEIAGALSLSQSAVKSRLHRSRRELAERMMREGAVVGGVMQDEPSNI